VRRRPVQQVQRPNRDTPAGLRRRQWSVDADPHLPPPDGAAVTVQIIGTDTTADIEIRDTGPGIPEHERPHVFERFYRRAVATELSIPGAGLGLATAQLIAERHHGTITAGPNDHTAGTTIRVHLPR
jgi:two-component system phosphate regulon sensor histidine kinase PhoR